MLVGFGVQHAINGINNIYSNFLFRFDIKRDYASITTDKGSPYWCRFQTAPESFMEFQNNHIRDFSSSA